MSFSAEMKDFLAAYKTGQGINASRTDQDYKEAQTARTTATTERENDPDTLKTAAEQARANLDLTRSRIANSGAARGATGARTELIREQLRQLRQGASGGTGLYPTGAINPTIQPGGIDASQPQPGAVPVVPSTIDTGEDMYAQGGIVPDNDADDIGGASDSDADDGVLDTSEAVPTAPAAPMSGATDFSARSREPRAPRGLEGIISPQLVADATKNGMTWGIQQFGLSDPSVLKSPQARLRAQQLARGMGGLSEQEMQAAKQAVDPEGKLSDSQRNMAALGSVYQFWANKGEPEKARRVAFQMLQYYRNASQRYAAIAAKAAEGGNIDMATKAALKAYANVPDGRDLEIMPNPDGGLMYTYTDSKGDVIAKGVATPQQLASSAMGLAQGGFDKAILAAAGAQEAPKEAVKTGGKTQSAGDRAKEAENVGGEIEKLKQSWIGKNKDKPVDEEQWNEIGNVAQHIYQQNPKATASEVARAAQAMLIPGDDPDPSKRPFKVTPGEEGKPNTITFGGKLKVQLDDDQLDSIINSRAAREKAGIDKINKDMEELDKPTTLDKVTEGAVQVGKGLAKVPSPAGAVASGVKGAYGLLGSALDKIYGEHIPEGLKKEVADFIEEGRQRYTSGARSISDRFSNTGAVPVDEGDRPL